VKASSKSPAAPQDPIRRLEEHQEFLTRNILRDLRDFVVDS
jgi:hypothetical protein